MVARVSHTTLNCSDAYELSERWKQVLPGWMVLADPAGNRFCIVRGDAERAP